MFLHIQLVFRGGAKGWSGWSTDHHVLGPYKAHRYMKFGSEQPNIEYIGASTAFRQYASCDPLRIRPVYTPSYPLLCCADVRRWRAGGRCRTTSDQRL